MKKKIAVSFVMAMSLVLALASVAYANYDYGYITLDDSTTSLNFYDAGPSYDAHAWDAAVGQPMHDYWDLTIATTYDAVVEIKWFDWYPTNDVYEVYVDGILIGTNPAGGLGVEQVALETGNTYTVEVRWIYYQTNKSTIAGGSYYDITFNVTEQFIGADIDIKPGSDPNSINLGSKGVIPVAILSSADFDASTVDPLTVKLADAEVKVKGKSDNAGSLEDVNGDGLLDLVVQVYTEGLLLAAGAIEVELTAQTYGGISVVGSDSIRIVPP